VKGNIAAICRHTGEEPPISGQRGICNVFFAHCNMQCVYCQNYEISRNTAVSPKQMSSHDITAEIMRLLPSCENRVGFVSPSHYALHVAEITDMVRAAGVHPVFVYNSNGYDRPETLRKLEGKIDIYLPDFKYSDDALAQQLSGVTDYPKIALAAIREMYRQKGSTLLSDDAGLAESGLIIRHLVLPGMVEQSINALRMIAEEISLSVHVSLMAQYFPPLDMSSSFPSINRTLYAQEYAQVIDAFYELGFRKGWMQSIESEQYYRPHFSNAHPFES
jgi:putative pyruvate formate lyase activating enzyme